MHVSAKANKQKLRAASDDLTIYEPFRTSDSSLSTALHFAKVYNPHLAKSPQEMASEEMAQDEAPAGPQPLRAINNLGGYRTVFVPGHSPAFILKSAKSKPRMVGLRGTGIRGLSSFNTAGCDHGFICVDSDGVARVSQLPANTNFDLGFPVQRINLGEDITNVAFHPPSNTYVVATNAMEPFELPKDDDHHREWAKEDVTFKPMIERSTLKLLSPATWSVIDSIELDPGEVIMSTKVLDLEVSEDTHERKQLITVGTGILKGEDLATKGRVYVFDVVTVVPEPGRPETNQKMKQLAKETVPRGAVTNVSEVGTQGCMIVAQGQKIMVRGLKEDGTLLPVAFMDVNTYVTSLKELPGSGLCIFADALKGLILAAYTEEPYKMILLGKQNEDMELVCAEMLPIGDQLFIVAADSDCNLHVLQYDPERMYYHTLETHQRLTNSRSQVPPRPTSAPPHILLLRRPSPNNNDAPPTHQNPNLHRHRCHGHNILRRHTRNSRNPHNDINRQHSAPYAPSRNPIPPSKHTHKQSLQHFISCLWFEPESLSYRCSCSRAHHRW